MKSMGLLSTHQTTIIERCSFDWRNIRRWHPPTTPKSQHRSKLHICNTSYVFVLLTSNVLTHKMCVCLEMIRCCVMIHTFSTIHATKCSMFIACQLAPASLKKLLLRSACVDGRTRRYKVSFYSRYDVRYIVVYLDTHIYLSPTAKLNVALSVLLSVGVDKIRKGHYQPRSPHIALC